MIRRVVGLVMAVHTLWIVLYVATGHEARDFVRIGKYYVELSDVSRDIVVDPDYGYPSGRSDTLGTFRGYDGQFAYFIAIDPAHAHHYMDAPRYRYSRILYPALAWVVAAGQDEIVPYALIVINWLAVAAGTWALALLLRRRGGSPWWAAVYGLAPGILIALQRDLTEPLAYAFVAAALLALHGRDRPRWLLAALLFTAAVLTRQTTLLFPLAWAAWAVLGRREILRGALLLALPMLAFLAWAAYLRSWLGVEFESTERLTGLPPLGWLFEKEFGLLRQPPMAVAVVLPGLIWLVAAFGMGREALRRPEWLCVVLNVGFFVLFAPAYNAFTSAGRAVVGVVLLAVLLAPTLPPRWRPVLAVAAGLHLVMTPVVFVYGLGDYSV